MYLLLRNGRTGLLIFYSLSNRHGNISLVMLAVVSGLQNITQISADQTTRELVESVNLDTGSLLSNAFPPPEKTT